MSETLTEVLKDEATNGAKDSTDGTANNAKGGAACDAKDDTSNSAKDGTPKNGAAIDTKDNAASNSAKNGATNIPTCSFFVYRKKRSCRMHVKPGKKFCGEHAHMDTEQQLEGEVNGRIPCPNDPKHTCDAKKLEKHLLKCPKKVEPLLEYVQIGINGCIEADPIPNLTIREVSDDKLMEVIARVNSVYETEIRYRVQTEILSHPVLEQEMSDNSSYYGPEVLKHLVQNSSLLGHLQSKGLLDSNTTFVEFGSGRGQLTYWIVKSTKNSSGSCRYFLIDRDSHRHKFDNKLRDQEPDAEVQRIRADIQNVVLAKVPGIQNCSNKVVSVSKHLCGVATDLALRCVNNFASDPTQAGKASSILIALCCHHRCLWSSYVGKEFFLGQGFTPEEFHLLCGLTSWATCGTGKPRSKENKEDEKEKDPANPQADPKVLSRYELLGLDRLKREEIGKRCKRIIDFGRAKFAEEKIGLKNSRLLFYVDQKYSLENAALFCS